MDEYKIIILFHSHVRTYTGQNPNTGASWTTGERMADIFRQIRKANAIKMLADGTVTNPQESDIAEVKTEMGMA